MNGKEQKLKPVSDRSAKIVEELAQKRFVENLVLSVTHHSWMTDDLADLTQIIYFALLEMETNKLETLVKANELRFFVVRMILNQYYSANSPYYKDVRKFKMKSSEISSQISESYEDKDGRLSFLTR